MKSLDLDLGPKHSPLLLSGTIILSILLLSVSVLLSNDWFIQTASSICLFIESLCFLNRLKLKSVLGSKVSVSSLCVRSMWSVIQEDAFSYVLSCCVVVLRISCLSSYDSLRSLSQSFTCCLLLTYIVRDVSPIYVGNTGFSIPASHCLTWQVLHVAIYVTFSLEHLSRQSGMRHCSLPQLSLGKGLFLIIPVVIVGPGFSTTFTLVPTGPVVLLLIVLPVLSL